MLFLQILLLVHKVHHHDRLSTNSLSSSSDTSQSEHYQLRPTQKKPNLHWISIQLFCEPSLQQKQTNKQTLCHNVAPILATQLNY